MPNFNVPPAGPRPEPQPPESDDRARERAALEHHLGQMLERLQAAVQQPGSPERAEELRGVVSEYTLGLLEGAVLGDGRLEAQLIKQGARTTSGTWRLDSDLFTFLSDEMALSVPTRLRALRDGQYPSVNAFNAGMLKQLRNLVTRYAPRRNPHADRRQGPAAAV